MDYHFNLLKRNTKRMLKERQNTLKQSEKMLLPWFTAIVSQFRSQIAWKNLLTWLDKRETSSKFSIKFTGGISSIVSADDGDVKHRNLATVVPVHTHTHTQRYTQRDASLQQQEWCNLNAVRVHFSPSRRVLKIHTRFTCNNYVKHT